MDETVVIDGRKVSVETIKAALEAYFKDKPEEPYVFQAGDVVDMSGCGKRVMAKCKCGLLIAIDSSGNWMSANHRDDNFEVCGYKKVGELKDYLKE